VSHLVSALAASLLLLLAVPVAAQVQADRTVSADTVVEVRLVDGTRFVGQVISRTEEELTLRTPGGTTLTLATREIREITLARGRIVDGQFRPDDPNQTRLLFAPTARPLPRGDAYISSYLLFFPFAGIAVTDRLTLAGGTPILPGAMGEVFYLAPKYTFVHRPGTDLAAGAIAFFATRDLDEGSLGIVYGMGTFGDPDRAITAGAGWGFSLGGRSSRVESDPVFLIGGELRMSDRTKFVTENWIASGSDTAGLLSGGVRFFGDRLSADLGLGAGFDGSSGFCCLPLVNFVYNIRRGG